MTKIKLRSSFPEWLDPTEAKIINRLITLILQSDPGYAIKVLDYEEGDTLYPKTRDRASIQRETAATGGTIFEVWQDTRFRPGEVFTTKWVPIARIYLIHGNGEDVIRYAAWSSKTPEVEALIDAWCAAAQEGGKK